MRHIPGCCIAPNDWLARILQFALACRTKLTEIRARSSLRVTVLAVPKESAEGAEKAFRRYMRAESRERRLQNVPAKTRFISGLL